MNLQNMKETDRLKLRKKFLRSLFCFCQGVMGYDDIIDSVHGEYCYFLERANDRKQVELPRSFIKTWIGSIAYPIWISLPRSEPDEFPIGIDPKMKIYNLGQNIRILLASYVIKNSMKFVNAIRKHYEANVAMQIFFPEVIPEAFSKVKWSDSEACIQRDSVFTESTFEAAGTGGSVVGRHYDMIIEDDLIYAKKDELSNQELQPSQENIDKAIGWHKLSMSLLVPGSHTVIHNIGTRWAKHDLIDYIRTNEPSYKIFKMSVIDKDGEPTWNEMYPLEVLAKIRAAQGPYMYSTQYLGLPLAPEDLLFKKEWLQEYTDGDLPKDTRTFTTVDLSGWEEIARKGHGSRGVVLTCSWCPKNHMWVRHYDVGRFNPSEVIDIIYKHYRLFKPDVIGIESVYYQKSLLFFLKREMEIRGWLPVRELMPGGGRSKDLRIRGLEPIASNLAIHCKKTHADFIMEFEEYSPNSKGSTKDILDAAAYQIDIAKPGVATSLTTRVKPQGDITIKVTTDGILKWAESRMERASGFPDQDRDMRRMTEMGVYDPNNLNPFAENGVVNENVFSNFEIVKRVN